MHYSAGPLAGLPPVVKNLLLINGLFFLVMVMGMGNWGGVSMTHWLGMHYFASPLFKPWQLVTHMFMHGGFGHLALNMIGLFMLGPPLEYKWGSKRFLTYYMITGVGAGLLYSAAHSFAYFRLLEVMDPAQVELVRSQGHELLMSQRNYVDPLLGELNAILNRPMVGASGALYGVLLAFGMTFPNVQLMIFPLFIPIRAKYFVLILGALALFQALADNPEDNVAHLAHLGGMVVGFVLIRIWRNRDVSRHWH